MKNNLLQSALIFAVLMTVSGLSLYSQGLQSSLFDEVNQSKASSKNAQADVLSPRTYQQAMEAYDEAKKLYKNEEELSEIKEKIKSANNKFREATENTRVSAVMFSGALSARVDALNAESDRFVNAIWKEAEAKMKDAAIQLEKGDADKAKEKSIEATDLYRKAELESIKANYLTNARRLLEKADKNKVNKTAPKTIASSRELLKSAENELLENRYDTDNARHLAKEAEYKALLATNIARLEEAYDDKDYEVEDYLLMSYEPLATIGQSMNLNLRFDGVTDGPVTEITDRIRGYQSRISNLEASLFNYKMTNESLRSMLRVNRNILDGMKGQLSDEAILGQKRQVALQNRIDRMAEINDKFEQVQKLFNEKDAQVFRQNNDVIIRMIGINFEVGKAQINQKDYAQLTKLQEAMNLFKDANIVIEGHTDSQGGDELNLKLSRERADAILSYLNANTSIDKSRFSTKGFGESKPVANNETVVGRKLNRRIDIVIKPNFPENLSPDS
ncbi:OmpA family protein [Reichenbachiella ulvae]|uniref:OmpA family protein n=1 Tax=Reichenbachiella ulvae TaxID=2980104 RepID=A0ABT3CQI5_9BACT|nr:OmpA family protein [Reichenbachiella ulvae]MCV9385975.1 OmpA family protein [Reichenbachiella ulvae]